MNALSIVAVLGFLAAQPVLAKAEAEPINVPDWLDGCAELTVSAHGTIMDTSCLVNAQRYCGFSGQLDAVDICLQNLAEHLDGKGLQISQTIKIPVDVPDHSRRGMEITLKNNLEGRDPLECLPEWSSATCSSSRAGMNWLNWRGLSHRVEYVLQRQDNE